MNPVEIGLAFIEGLALIASPCILPVLPLVLSASVEGGRKRPYGIITGFVLSFSLFAYASRLLVSALHIDVGVIRNASLVLLFLFGLVLLSEKLSQKFSAATQGAASLGSKVSGSGSGYFSGVVLGALIGLVWTPCAGPILATVLVQVIRQQNDLNGFFIILAFAFGAGVPMFIIAVTGRKFMNKLGFFSRHAEAVRKVFGVIIILSVVFLAAGGDVQSLVSPGSKQTDSGSVGLEKALPQPYTAPEFVGISDWINSSPLTMASLKGKVVLVDFWTYSCINCIRTLPYITDWDKKYRDAGLVIVGVHSPEFEFEKDMENVKAAVAQRGIHYPVALDNHLDTWASFNNQYWPAHYLIDRDGKVVYTHFGEGDYDVTEHNIRTLLGVKDGVPQAAAAPQAIGGEQTPETYVGYARAQHYAGEGGATHDTPADHHFPKFLPGNHWALDGKWLVKADHIEAQEKAAALRFNFKAQHVYLVLGTATGNPVDATVTLNGAPVGSAAGQDAPAGKLHVTRHTLYELIDQHQSESALLELTADAPGLEAYAFTFGN